MVKFGRELEKPDFCCIEEPSPQSPNPAGYDESMLDFDVYENPFREEIVTQKFELRNGDFDVPTGPGLGIEINEDVVRKYAQQ